MGKIGLREHPAVFCPSHPALVLDFNPLPCPLLPFSAITPRDLETRRLDPIPQRPGVLSGPLYGCVSLSTSNTQKSGLSPSSLRDTFVFIPRSSLPNHQPSEEAAHQRAQLLAAGPPPRSPAPGVGRSGPEEAGARGFGDFKTRAGTSHLTSLLLGGGVSWKRDHRGVLVTMEDPLPKETLEQQDSSKERSPRNAGGDICHLGALQCTRCLITFANSKFQERHMKREHPADFVAQKLQGALFICFTCARSFLSSKALIAHQRSHSPATRPSLPVVPTIAQPTFPCPDCGKTFGQAASLRQHRQVHEAHSPPGPFACTECGQDFAQEAGLHQHYIRHARGEL